MAFIDNNPSLDNDLTYNLDFIVSSGTADCGDVSLAAYNLFTKAEITARVVKAYITEDGADVKKYGKKIDAHVICIFKQGDNWGFIDEQSIIEPQYRDPQGIFCGYSVFKCYVIRARFVNEAKWNSIIREAKEPEDGPIAENIFYDNNFFYVQTRDKCK
jgi:hypothetical protein